MPGSFAFMELISVWSAVHCKPFAFSSLIFGRRNKSKLSRANDFSYAAMRKYAQKTARADTIAN
jgi:hypothetical protein